MRRNNLKLSDPFNEFPKSLELFRALLRSCHGGSFWLKHTELAFDDSNSFCQIEYLAFIVYERVGAFVLPIKGLFDELVLLFVLLFDRFSHEPVSQSDVVVSVIRFLFWFLLLLLLHTSVVPRRYKHQVGWGVGKSEQNLRLSVNSGQLVGDGGEIKLGPFLQFIIVVLGLILEYFVGQRVGVYVVHQFSNIDDELVQGEVNESLLIHYFPQILFEVLFRVLCLENHDRQKLGVQAGLVAFGCLGVFLMCDGWVPFLIGKLFGLQKSLIDGQNIPHEVVVGFSRDKGVLVGALEGIFYLLEGKGLDLLFNQIVELFRDIFVDFPIFPLLVQELIAAQIPRIE